MIDLSRQGETGQRPERKTDVRPELKRELEVEGSPHGYLCEERLLSHCDMGLSEPACWSPEQGRKREIFCLPVQHQLQITSVQLCASVLGFLTPEPCQRHSSWADLWEVDRNLWSNSHFTSGWKGVLLSSLLGEGVPQPDGKLWTEINPVHV